MKLSPKMEAYKARQAERAKRLAVRNKTIRHDVKAGIPIAEIARKYLITRGWVKQIAGIPPEPRSICQHARAAAIVRGRLSGLTFGDLARRYGVTPERVRQIHFATIRRRDRRAAYQARQAERAEYRVKRDCDIVRELRAGVSVARLGRRYQITCERVRQIAKTTYTALRTRR
jgi:Mor family transcriptional regulator